jgi:O-antigen/teichoic acid export membrane protein
MRRIAHQAAVLSAARIANYGLMVISPLVLVRFLTVTDFGRYREFLLYASLLQAAAVFGISDSLLYFIPRHPASMWRVVRETASLTAGVSVVVVGIFVVIDLLVPGGLVGPYLVPVALYVLLFVNVDWWESLWVSTGQPLWVFVYGAGRLIARLVVVVCVAVVTKNVSAVIGSLLVLEGLRLTGALLVWIKADQSSHEPQIGHIRGEQLRFCVPFGLGGLLGMLSRNLGNVVIAQFLGVAALAHLTVGTYGEPIIMAMRNSISQVLLPELVRLQEYSRDEALRLWRRTMVVNCMLLFPVAAVVAWYAEPLILTAFGAAYRPAIPVLQWYALLIARSCIDFSPLMRAINKTGAFIAIGAVDVVVNALALAVLLPLMGIIGAVIALVIARFCENLMSSFVVRRLYGVRGLLPWAAMTKVGVCAAAGAVIAFGITFELRATLLGAVCGSVLYGVVFAALLLATGVEEATTLFRRFKTSLAAVRRR